MPLRALISLRPLYTKYPLYQCIMVEKLFNSHFNSFFNVCILAFSCISYKSTINTYKFKTAVEVYPIDVNPIEVYPIEAYLIGKGVVEVSGVFEKYFQTEVGQSPIVLFRRIRIPSRPS
jgi:hypothetical protein